MHLENGPLYHPSMLEVAGGSEMSGPAQPPLLYSFTLEQPSYVSLVSVWHTPVETRSDVHISSAAALLALQKKSLSGCWLLHASFAKSQPP